MYVDITLVSKERKLTLEKQVRQEMQNIVLQAQFDEHVRTYSEITKRLCQYAENVHEVAIILVAIPLLLKNLVG